MNLEDVAASIKKQYQTLPDGECKVSVVLADLARDIAEKNYLQGKEFTHFMYNLCGIDC